MGMEAPDCLAGPAQQGGVESHNKKGNKPE